jgi:hypothetical protein
VPNNANHRLELPKADRTYDNSSDATMGTVERLGSIPFSGLNGRMKLAVYNDADWAGS